MLLLLLLLFPLLVLLLLPLTSDFLTSFGCVHVNNPCTSIGKLVMYGPEPYEFRETGKVGLKIYYHTWRWIFMSLLNMLTAPWARIDLLPWHQTL